MKLKKILEIKERCLQCANSNEVADAHPEWHNCRACPLKPRVEIKAEIDANSTQNGLDGVTIKVNPCLILEEIAGQVKHRSRGACGQVKIGRPEKGD